MDRNQLNKYIATIIVAIGPEGQPNSHVWMAVDPQMADLQTYNLILGALTGQGLVKNSGHFLTLLPKGVEMFHKLMALYKPQA